MTLNIDTFDRRVGLSMLLLVPVGLGAALVGWLVRGSDDNRFVLGGLCLALSAIVGAAAYLQIRLGKMPVRQPTSKWVVRMEWVDRKDRPVRYWLTTIMYACCSVTLLVYAMLFFVFSAKILD
jgi:hypothetical protein